MHVEGGEWVEDSQDYEQEIEPCAGGKITPSAAAQVRKAARGGGAFWTAEDGAEVRIMWWPEDHVYGIRVRRGNKIVESMCAGLGDLLDTAREYGVNPGAAS